MQFNPDLDGAMNGISSKTNVLVTSTLMVPASTSTNRRSVTLINREPANGNPIYFNYGRSVTAATNANCSLQPGESINLHLRCAIYGIATGATVLVEWYTEED